jgi:tRNA threonylcarbamoyladenosine biosynthesis protein TsaB
LEARASACRLSYEVGLVRILAIETSTAGAEIALVEAGQLIVEQRNPGERRSAESLLPLIASGLASAGWSKRSIERIAVAVGPGSFTGVRVGIACAQGLSLGLDRPLVGVGSLRAMALSVPENVRGIVCALSDAKRNEVFAAAYESGHERLAPVALPCAGAPSELERLLGAPLVFVGAGTRLLGFEPAYSDPRSERPSAYGVARAAAQLSPDEHPAVPIYVRDAGATLPARQ